MVTRLFGFDCLLNEGDEIVIRSATRQNAIEVMIEVGKEAGANLAVGRETDTAAGTAKSLRYGGDDADFPHTIVESVAARGFTGVVGGQSHQRAKAVELVDHLLQRNDYFRGPQAVFFERHELDKANNHALVAREAGKGNDLVIVEAAQQHTVHFDRAQPGTLGRAQSRQYLF